MDMSKDIFNIIRKYGKEMTSNGYSVGKEAKIYLKSKGNCYVTGKEADLGELQEEDIKVISQEELHDNIEAEILMKRMDINALVISNTPYCDRSSRKDKEIYAVLDDMAQIVGPKAPLVNYNKSEISKGLKVAAVCIVRNKYTISTGRNLYEAVVAMEVLEKSAEVFLKAQVLNGGKRINELEARLMRFIYKKKYSKGEEEVKSLEMNGCKVIDFNSAANELNKEGEGIIVEKIQAVNEEKLQESTEVENKEEIIRALLVEYGKKLLERGLVQGTWGNLSVRLNDDYMLVTPSGIDYNRLTSKDMVKVNINTLEYEGDKKPTSEKDLHGSIYALRKEVGAVIHTHSKYCSIFAAAGKSMPIESKEMMKSFGEEVLIAKYGLPGTKMLTRNTMKALGKSFGCIMANHGMIGCGHDMKEAFENCLKLEECGKKYIESRYK